MIKKLLTPLVALATAASICFGSLPIFASETDLFSDLDDVSAWMETDSILPENENHGSLLNVPSYEDIPLLEDATSVQEISAAIEVAENTDWGTDSIPLEDSSELSDPQPLENDAYITLEDSPQASISEDPVSKDSDTDIEEFSNSSDAQTDISTPQSIEDTDEEPINCNDAESVSDSALDLDENGAENQINAENNTADIVQIIDSNDLQSEDAALLDRGIVDSDDPEQEDAALQSLENEYSGSCGENLTWELNDGCLLISGSGKMESLLTYPWKDKNDEIVSIIFSGDISCIGDFAFIDCTNLKTVSLPQSIKVIGIASFHGCKSLTSIVLPASVESIGSYAFSKCESLKTIDLPDKLTSINRGIFSGCSGLTKVSIPDGVTEIADEAFQNCINLKSIELPTSISAIGNSAFFTCTDLTAITLPSGLMHLGTGAFRGCKNLKEIKIPGNITELAEQTFFECTSMKAITFESCMTEIKSNAFNSCGMLSDVYYPGYITDWEQIVFAAGNDTLKAANVHFKSADISSNLNVINLEYDYNGKPINPDFSMSWLTHELHPNFDYKIQIEGNNVNAGMIPVTVLGIGKFFGSVKSSYTIRPIDFGKVAPSVKLSYQSTDYDGNEKQIPVSEIAVSAGNFEYTLKEGTDYTLSYRNNVNVGFATIIIRGKGNFTGEIVRVFQITPKEFTPDVELSESSYTYNGKAKKPSLTVWDKTTDPASPKKLIEGTDYTVKYADGLPYTAGRKVPGTYKVTVTLKGNYSGSKTVSFTILPKSTTVSKATGASKSITVKWKKQATQTTGYQIQYSTSKTFKSGTKTVTVSKPGTTSKKITGLKAKKTYYVRVRTYKKIGKKMYYSGWSKAKTVKTK